MRIFIDGDVCNVTDQVAQTAARLGLLIVFTRFPGFSVWLRSKLRQSDLLVSDDPDLTEFARDLGAVVLTPQGSLVRALNRSSCDSTSPPPSATARPF